MHDSDNNQDARKKKAIWRAEHRGMREMDLLMGSFAREHVPAMDETALKEFEMLIAVGDVDLYDWILGRVETPSNFCTPVFTRLKQHQFNLQSYGR